MHYNIPGVKTIYSQNPGPNIGISYFTHGNEPVGKKIVDYLLNVYKIEKNIIAGSISFIHVNLEASKQKKRYLNHNMNRIRNQDFQEHSYEHQRKNELVPFLDTLDILFDIHSTPKPSPCICITDEKFLHEAKGFFSGADIWIGDMYKQGALISYFTHHGKAGFGIEAGSHIDEAGFTQGVNNVLNFLSYYGVIERPLPSIHYESVYLFLDEIFCTHSSFTYSKDFIGLQKVSHDEVIAQEDSKVIKNTYTNDNIYFGLAAKYPIVGDGAGFFFQKIE